MNDRDCSSRGSQVSEISKAHQKLSHAKALAMTMKKSNRNARRVSFLLKCATVIVGAWVIALIAAAAGMPLVAVFVLVLVVSAGVFRLLKQSEPPEQ